VPKISSKLKLGHPNGGAKCRWGRLNAGAVAENWRLSTRSVDNWTPRSQLYHTERPSYLFAALWPWCSASRGFVSDSSWSLFNLLCKSVMMWRLTWTWSESICRSRSYIRTSTHASWLFAYLRLSNSHANGSSVLLPCWLGGRKGIRPVKTEWWGTGVVMSAARCKWFAYGSADATATPSSLAPAKSRMIYLSGAGLPRSSRKKAIKRI